jgi:hypothetical protein
MPQSKKQQQAPAHSTVVAMNWQKLIQNAIRPAVVSRLSTAPTGRHRAGGSAVHNDWFTPLGNLQTGNGSVSHKKRSVRKRK